MKLQIGKVYNLKYVTNPKEISEPVVPVKYHGWDTLVSDLQERKQEITESAKAKKELLKPYVALQKKLVHKMEKEVNAAHFAGKQTVGRYSDEVKQMKAEVAEMKANLFPSNVDKKNLSRTEALNKLLARAYNLDDVYEVEEGEGFEVVYAGKQYTSTGKEINRFYKHEGKVYQSAVERIMKS